MLLEAGADLVGVADLSAVIGEDMPFGVAIALAYPPAILRSLDGAGPNLAYYQLSQEMDAEIEAMTQAAAELLIAHGYRALVTEELSRDDPRKLPHKTVATRAGLGWIGKSSLLVTKEFGCALMLSSLLTDYPLSSDAPNMIDYCNKCTQCQKVCPAEAITGQHWRLGLSGESFFHAEDCKRSAKAQCEAAFGRAVPYCGRCMAVCPYTKRSIRRRQG